MYDLGSIDGEAQEAIPRDAPPTSVLINNNKNPDTPVASMDTNQDTNVSNNNTINDGCNEDQRTPDGRLDSVDEHPDDGPDCYSQMLNDEIRSRLDKLNALSDLINSLERKFDEANYLFRDTLKCSASRLGTISRALGNKSIKYGRVYNAAKISVEQSQAECQKACVQFEKANIDHQSAKRAIQEAEFRLRELTHKEATTSDVIGKSSVESLNINNLKLTTDSDSEVASQSSCDNTDSESSPQGSPTGRACCDASEKPDSASSVSAGSDTTSSETIAQEQLNIAVDENDQSPTSIIKSAARLSEELNLAILRLKDAERNRGLSEKQHLDQANKLMLAQENLLKLERDHGQSIRRSQLYFEESKRINAQLNSLKGDINRISDEILEAKQAYARTLSELEQFSDNLHVNSEAMVKN